ncbi:hypothetical protein GCM10010326_67410 [Streptomyces xanthochromogenes]|uniref:Uncharacterized protein n=1 Tax=Streptomyces xanthochromogenes TaxID=67384 RepID=A0ABQ3ASV4_9ACTN|nr:hypothetical protein GCM10010326_67410 [Streptomyces xanthochromogenes]
MIARETASMEGDDPFPILGSVLRLATEPLCTRLGLSRNPKAMKFVVP